MTRGRQSLARGSRWLFCLARQKQREERIAASRRRAEPRKGGFPW